MMEELCLDSIFNYGKKHRGKTLGHILENDASYIDWYMDKFPNRFKLTKTAMKVLQYEKELIQEYEDELREYGAMGDIY